MKRMFIQKDFTLLLLTDFLSVAGLWFAIFANLQVLTHLVPSDFGVSLILSAGPLFMILASPTAGRVIDRSPLSKVIRIGGLIQVLASASLSAAYVMRSVVLLTLALIVLNVANSFYTPALKSAIPLLVPLEKRMQANAVYMNVTTMARIGMTALSGLALSVLPLGAVYGISVCCYLAAGILRFGIRIGEPFSAIARKPGAAPFREVFRVLKETPVLRVLMGNTALIYLFLGGSNLIILKISSLHGDPAMQGFLYGVEGICLIASGAAAQKWHSRFSSPLLVNTVLVMGVGLAVLVLSFAPAWTWAAYAGYGLFGLMVGWWSPSYSTISQNVIPEGIRGRFFAFQEMWNRLLQQLALWYTGLMFDWTGPGPHLAVTSSIIIIGALGMTWSVRRQHDLPELSAAKMLNQPQK